MTIYVTTPLDDSNLDIEVTEANDLVKIDIQPASFTFAGGAGVSSVNGQVGVVVLDTDDIPEGIAKYYTDAKVQTVIDANTNDYSNKTYVDAQDDAVETAANLYTDGAVTGLATTTYVDTQDGVTLSSANTYTDTSIAAIPAVDLSSYETIVNSEAGDATTLSSANTYTDTSIAAIPAVDLSAYETIVNSEAGDATTLSSANTYTDTSIAAIPATDLSAYSTTIEVEALPVSTFTNDAGYITSAPDSQTLSFATPNLTISDGNTVDLSALSGGNVTSVNTQIGDVVLDTDDITEGTTNLYHTDARSRDSISLTADTSSLTYDNVSGVFTYTDPTGSPAPASHLEITVRNKTGVTIPANSAVYISGVQGNNDLIELAVNTGTNPAMGVTTSSINNNSNGIMIIGGEIGSFNTSAYTENDALYLSSTAGELTNVRPGAETEFVQNVGRVVRSGNNGTIIVQGAGRANDVPNLDSLHVFIGDTIAPERRQLTYTDILNTPDLTGLAATTYVDTQDGTTLTSANTYTDNAVAAIPAAPVTSVNGAVGVVVLDTDDVTEGTNKYYTDAQVLTKINATGINALSDVNTTAPTEGQVLAWDNTNGYYIPTDSGGGGGASSLEDLTDVAILNLQNNDLLIYNGTATEWQNTNLGISIAPTLSGTSVQSTGQTYILTISNHASYDDPAYFVEVYDSLNSIVIYNSQVTDNQDGTITFVAPSAVGTYEIRAKTQDFGDLQSEITTKSFTTEAFGGTFRYWRIANYLGNPSNLGIKDIRLYTGAGQSGTSYPPNMTSETTPSPYVATASAYYTPSGQTYAPWKAFDSSASTFSWYLAQGSVATAWNEIDLGSSVSITSLTVGPWHSAVPTQFDVLASDTGAFSGEETVITVFVTGVNDPVTTVYNIG